MPLPRWKRFAFIALVAVLVAGVVEVMARAAGVVIAGQRFTAGRLQDRRDALVRSGGRAGLRENVRWNRDEVLHPYVGYAPGPDGSDAARLLGPSPQALPRRGAERVIVAMVGGSVAHVFAEQGLPRLIERLSELDAYRGRRFVPLNLAVGGYKQPQTFMAVAYLLALGAEFDVVINLDGFNDVTMHPAENASHGVPMEYPRRWDQRVEGVLQGSTLRLALERVLIEQRRARLAKTFSHWPWRALNTTNLLYLAFDRSLEAQQAAVDRQMLGTSGALSAAAKSGGGEQVYLELADLWARSSLQLARLVEANGARYYHFLQPNQYVAGSKPLAAVERAEAVIADHPYRRAVESGYPFLRRAGASLRNLGVEFADLCMAFSNHPEPIYIDSCCHVNERGNAILADLMFEVIRHDKQLALPAQRLSNPYFP